MKNTSIIIIGGGLSGLTLAYRLAKSGIGATIIEARGRLGGRILTTGSNEEVAIDMGATWLGKKHRALYRLLQELGLDIHEQYMGERAFYEPISTSPPQLVTLPPNEEPSYRIKGGSSRLIDSLAQTLSNENILTGEAVLSIRLSGKECIIETTTREITADFTVTTLPPKLLVESVSFDPALPENLVGIAKKTHTWMAESIKFGISYSKPFWRGERNSGTLFSNTGPIPEMYDHSATDGSGFALKGFLKEAYHSVSAEERKRLVFEKLEKMYGDEAHDYLSYRETVWRHEPFTFSEYREPIIPHQNKGNPIYEKTFWDGKLIISGSETAEAFPGYMEGAVQSANRTVAKIEALLSSGNSK